MIQMSTTEVFSLDRFFGEENDHAFLLPVQVTEGPCDLLLSVKGQSPGLSQVASRSAPLASGVVWLPLPHGWTWAGLLVCDDVRGERSLWSPRQDMHGGDLGTLAGWRPVVK